MFGKNEVAEIDQRADGSLNVHSIFYTIQGEGPDAGRPAIFLRLATCNLRCYFCDTEFAKGTRHDLTSLANNILAKLKELGCGLVVITGGEPLLQNFVPLVELLNKQGINVSVESAGSVWLDGLQNYFAGGVSQWKGNKLVVSPKTPKLNDRLLPQVAALKYVVKAGELADDDGLPTMSTQLPGQPARLYRPSPIMRATVPIYLSPMDECSETLNAANARAAAEACMKFGYRLTMQLHKMVGLP